jgi:hypothetical protein
MFQLIGCQIDLGGNRDSVIVRSRHDNPVTFPELLVLKNIHGDEHVHHLMSVGETERGYQEEFERLQTRYGGEVMATMFPGPLQMLPLADDALPTDDEVFAGEMAAQKARDAAKAKRRPKMELPKGSSATQDLPA